MVVHILIICDLNIDSSLVVFDLHFQCSSPHESSSQLWCSCRQASFFFGDEIWFWLGRPLDILQWFHVHSLGQTVKHIIAYCSPHTVPQIRCRLLDRWRCTHWFGQVVWWKIKKNADCTKPCGRLAGSLEGPMQCHSEGRDVFFRCSKMPPRSLLVLLTLENNFNSRRPGMARHEGYDGYESLRYAAKLVN